MINLLPYLLSIGGIIAPNANVNEFYNHLPANEQLIIDNGYYSHIKSYSNTDSYIGVSKDDILSDLKLRFPNYEWSYIETISTSDASNAVPRNVNGYDDYSFSTIRKLCSDLKLPSTYGGCGPIAMMGILDYFSYYLDYNNIAEDPSLINDQKKIILDVLKETKTYEVGFGEKQTLAFPNDISSAFNKLMLTYNLENRLSSDYLLTLTPNKKLLLDRVYKSIEKGYPVTLGIGSNGLGSVYNHYTNIYSISRYSGINANGEYLFKDYLGLRINTKDTINTYFDSEILNSFLCTIITYDTANLKQQCLNAQTFKDFVNKDMRGQYFFYQKNLSFTTTDGFWLDTRRLRTSFIENKYLVMSANKVGAGTAYLHFNLYPALTEFSFESSLWGSKEFIQLQNFKIQYFKNNKWVDHLSYNLNEFSTSKEKMEKFYVLLPSYPNEIRFITTIENPTATFNRGRICLENITLFYDKLWW